MNIYNKRHPNHKYPFIHFIYSYFMYYQHITYINLYVIHLLKSENSNYQIFVIYIQINRRHMSIIYNKYESTWKFKLSNNHTITWKHSDSLMHKKLCTICHTYTKVWKLKPSNIAIYIQRNRRHMSIIYNKYE